MATILFSSHDLQFIRGYMQALAAAGHTILVDEHWAWDRALNPVQTRKLRAQADIVFCEWACANARWHAEQPADGKRIVVRAHLQELQTGFNYCIEDVPMAHVHQLIFVARDVMEAYLAGHPEITSAVHIPNFLQGSRFRLPAGDRTLDTDTITLGQLGTVRWRKRPDRSVAVLRRLLEAGHDARLFIKGDRAESRPFMHAKQHREELQRFYDLYAQTETDPMLAGRVIFEPFGADVAEWYRKIDHILSPSDFECFHYALADGVLSGCNPVLWGWQGAAETYGFDWVIPDTGAAVKRILEWEHCSAEKRAKCLFERREGLLARYGDHVVFPRLSRALILGETSPADPY